MPDQHAAFGITRAMERRREGVWRDLGLQELVNGNGVGREKSGGVVGGRRGRGRGEAMGMGGRRGCLR